MTSPAITKSTESQKADKKSPAHSAHDVSARAAATAAATAAASRTPELSRALNWMRVFKMSDLLINQVDWKKLPLEISPPPSQQKSV